ncbi:hypothetical protein MRX96_050723 [Rhipicephalus microplus]
MGSPTPRDELINRLVDRRPACASHNMYRSGDYDFIILLAFLAAVVVVFVLFFQYDFGQRLRQRVRTKQPAFTFTYHGGIASTSPSDHHAAKPGALREMSALSEEPHPEVTMPKERDGGFDEYFVNDRFIKEYFVMNWCMRVFASTEDNKQVPGETVDWHFMTSATYSGVTSATARTAS